MKNKNKGNYYRIYNNMSNIETTRVYKEEGTKCSIAKMQRVDC